MPKKLYVEVCSAKDLMPKDGRGSANPFCVIDFGGQKRRTEVKPKDLNPAWNATVDFTMFPDLGDDQTLVLQIFSEKKGAQRQAPFLGRVKIKGFVRKGKEEVIFYPLRGRSILSQIKGEIGLKIWWDDEPEPPPPPPPADPDPAPAPAPAPAEAAAPAEVAAAPSAEGTPPPAEGAAPPPAEAAPSSEGSPAPEATPPAEEKKEEEKKEEKKEEEKKEEPKDGEKKDEEKKEGDPVPEAAAAVVTVIEEVKVENVVHADCLIQGTNSFVQTLYWDHINHLYPEEVVWNTCIPSSTYHVAESGHEDYDYY